ncbi:MAG: hypothetical protein ACXVAK_05765 [Vulcanimicrobiaceae bacterium]
MARTVDEQHRSELLELIVAYVLDNGIADLSLRPLARAVGASPRVRLYYFKSKEVLIAGSSLAPASVSAPRFRSCAGASSIFSRASSKDWLVFIEPALLRDGYSPDDARAIASASIEPLNCGSRPLQRCRRRKSLRARSLLEDSRFVHG